MSAALALALCVATTSGPEAAPATTTGSDVAAVDDDGEPAKLKPPYPDRPHFVFAHSYGLTFGLNTIPSGEVAFFFGRAIGERDLSVRRWALGYQATVSVGGAERYSDGVLTLRSHLMAATYRAHDRLYASMALGLALFHGWFPQVLEGEGKIALVFGARRRRSQTAGLVGANLRLGWNFFHDERAPAPQIGAFIGFVHR
ncbi:MAG: hypothetical protein KC486_11800 [Myxococcales bacterium]|nr:hypothetical protein [Myxococcales bacterium]